MIQYKKSEDDGSLKTRKQNSRGTWSVSEDEALTKAVELYGAKNWKKIAESVPGRSDVQCLHRWQKVLNPELVKGPWTDEEDQKVRDLVKIHGPKKWSLIASYLPGRIGKQCRERWTNHLDPCIKKGNWEPWEDELIVKLQREIGNKWARIAQHLPGRTDNAIKNRFNSTISRKIRQTNKKNTSVTKPKRRGLNSDSTTKTKRKKSDDFEIMDTTSDAEADYDPISEEDSERTPKTSTAESDSELFPDTVTSEMNMAPPSPVTPTTMVQTLITTQGTAVNPYPTTFYATTGCTNMVTVTPPHRSSIRTQNENENNDFIVTSTPSTDSHQSSLSDIFLSPMRVMTPQCSPKSPRVGGSRTPPSILKKRKSPISLSSPISKPSKYTNTHVRRRLDLTTTTDDSTYSWNDLTTLVTKSPSFRYNEHHDGNNTSICPCDKGYVTLQIMRKNVIKTVHLLARAEGLLDKKNPLNNSVKMNKQQQEIMTAVGPSV